MVRRFIIGDPHFGDPRILRYCRNDKFSSVEEMDAHIISQWNNTVKKHDIVFINGDLSRMKNDEDYLFINDLHGKKILIRGNHDKRSDQCYYDAGIFKVYDYPIMYGDALISHIPTFVNPNTPFVNIYAHIHNNPNYNVYSVCGYCTSVELNNYAPVDIDYITKKIGEERKKYDIKMFKNIPIRMDNN